MKLVFINGLGGSGKSTLVKWFHQHPLKGWVFLDFDEGQYPVPHPRGSDKEWKAKQHEWFLQEAHRIQLKDSLNVCVVGVCLFPWKAKGLPSIALYSENEITYGYLRISPEVRLSRLKNRGTEDQWEGDAEQLRFEDVAQKLDEAGVMSFDADKSTEEIAQEIGSWLKAIEAEN